jgi:3-oxoacyl-[acyl-carrier protein] reductase
MAAFQEIPELRRRLEARTALGRIGDPETDVGAVVRFLAGDDASYVTGQTIVCDGGGFIGL